jgi:DNA-binding transcriptional ArsR family regulator
MIFETPAINQTLARQLKALDELRGQLGEQAAAGSVWLGGLRRKWRARAASSSIEIEGYRVTPAGVETAIMNTDGGAGALDVDRMALACYARAMDHVGVMSGDSSFEWVQRVVLDLHFDACYFQKDKHPGRYRRGPVVVTGSAGGRAAYTGPPHSQLESLMAETMSWLELDEPSTHVVVRAAMAHLHVVSIHPFEDGNGRVSRIVQSLVLAREGLLAPEFLSIEEYLRDNTPAYYAALGEVQGGSYRPERDATSWVQFCLKAHLEQAQRRLRQLAEAGLRWSYLERLVERRGWPERLVIALEQSLFAGADRAGYIAEADVSAPTASNDFRRLLDAGLINRRGRGRNTRYFASDALAGELRQHLAGG